MEAEFDFGVDGVTDCDDLPTEFGSVHHLIIQFGVQHPRAQQTHPKLDLGLSQLTLLHKLAAQFVDLLLLLAHHSDIEPHGQTILQRQQSHRPRPKHRHNIRFSYVPLQRSIYTHPIGDDRRDGLIGNAIGNWVSPQTLNVEVGGVAAGGRTRCELGFLAQVLPVVVALTAVAAGGSEHADGDAVADLKPALLGGGGDYVAEGLAAQHDCHRSHEYRLGSGRGRRRRWEERRSSPLSRGCGRV